MTPNTDGRAPSQGLVPTFGLLCVCPTTDSGCRLVGDGTSADQNSQSAGGLGAKQDPGLARVLPILDLLNDGLRERTLEGLANPPAPEPEASGRFATVFNSFFKMLSD